MRQRSKSQVGPLHDLRGLASKNDLEMLDSFKTLVAPGFERKWVMVTLTVMTLMLLGVLSLCDRLVRNDLSPFGMVSFELSTTKSNGEAMVRQWTMNQRVLVAFMLGIDYLFIPVYVASICYACVWAADMVGVWSEPASVAGEVIAQAQFVAGLLDCIENACLLFGLLNPDKSMLAFPTATLCAMFKFIIVFLGLSFVAFAYVRHRTKNFENWSTVWRRLRKRSSSSLKFIQ
mmetsp:Transcript_14352/g.25711  ORF Transcript_14352/g.25711 Transcript_14352/m.25711 type:complete len:232 (-) Transcript_14352:193-888(-)